MDVIEHTETLGKLVPNQEPLPVIRIQPSRGWASLNLRELWEYRELLYFLIWRDIKVRYKQTALGAAWAIIQPFFTMVVFSLFFGRLAQDAVGWHSLPDFQLRRAGALDLLRQRPEPSRRTAWSAAPT